MASTATATAARPVAPPSQTLYIQNLPDSKIAKSDLRTLIYTLFATYGPVLDVVTLKTAKHRGQSHVVFRDIGAATMAMKALQGFEVVGKKIRIQYALTKSHKIMKLEGTFAPTRKQDGPVGGTAGAAFVALPGQEAADKEKEKAETTSSSDKVVAGVKRARDEDDEGAKEGEGRGSEGPAGGVSRSGKPAEEKKAEESKQQDEDDEDEGEEMEMDEDDD